MHGHEGFRAGRGSGVERTEGGLGHHDALDGLRAVAVIAVVLFHSDLGWARGGFLGVSAFFTLSGFLITTVLLDEHRTAGSISLTRFWTRRVRRLLPAALFAVLLAAMYVAVAAPHDVASAFRGDAIAALFDVANWRFVASGNGYLDTFSLATGAETVASPVLHFWSLAIEEQFYLAFPVVVLALLRLGRGRRRVLAAGLAALAVASVVAGIAWSAPGAVDRAYLGTDTRAVELLIGALLAVALMGRAPSGRVARGFALAAMPAAAALLAAWVVADHTDVVLFRGGLVVHAILAAVVIGGLLVPGPLQRCLALGPLVAVGRISYGVYLFHWPIFQWVTPGSTVFGARPFAAGSLGTATLLAVRVALTVALAAASAAWLELPIRLGRRGNGRRLALAAVPSFAACIAAAIVASAAAPPATTVFAAVAAGPPPVARETAAGSSVRALATAVVVAERRLVSSTVSGSGAAASRRLERVLVVGDSVALTLGRGVERWGADRGVAVWNLGLPKCGIARGERWVALRRIPASERCDAWPDEWAAAVAAFDPDVVLVLSPVWDLMLHRAEGWDTFRGPGDPLFETWLAGEYRLATDVLATGGARVVWLDVPCPEGENADRATTAVNGVIAEVVGSRSDATSISIAEQLCGPDAPFAGVRSDDRYHFTETGADTFGAWLMTRIPGFVAPEVP